MRQPTRPVPSVWAHLAPLLAEVAASCGQARTADRFLTLTVGLQQTLGRHTITQVLQGVGRGECDWTADYALFQRARFDLDVGRRALLATILAALPREAPLVVVPDATQLPRTSTALVGVGLGPCPRNPVWAPGLHLAQRWVGVSALLPLSPAGASRAVPLSFVPAPTPRATPWPGQPPRTEGEAAGALLVQLHADLAALDQAARPLLVVADGSYSGAPFLAALPANATLLARCAKNRALYALPTAQPRRGRRRLYGPQAPRPDHDLTSKTGWKQVRLPVRGRVIPVRYRLRGPYRIKRAPDRPVFLLVVGGVRNRPGHKRRDPSFWLVTAVPDAQGAWVLPYPVKTLLGWAWQRWEVEVMHRELKSGFGLGEQQAWSPVAARTTIQWVVWSYATLVLAGYLAWGWERGPPGPKWWRRRRWTARTVVQAVREELWQHRAAAFRPVRLRTPATPREMPLPPLPMHPFALLTSRL